MPLKGSGKPRPPSAAPAPAPQGTRKRKPSGSPAPPAKKPRITSGSSTKSNPTRTGPAASAGKRNVSDSSKTLSGSSGKGNGKQPAFGTAPKGKPPATAPSTRPTKSRPPRHSDPDDSNSSSSSSSDGSEEPDDIAEDEEDETHRKLWSAGARWDFKLRTRRGTASNPPNKNQLLDALTENDTPAITVDEAEELFSRIKSAKTEETFKVHLINGLFLPLAKQLPEDYSPQLDTHWTRVRHNALSDKIFIKKRYVDYVEVFDTEQYPKASRAHLGGWLKPSPDCAMPAYSAEFRGPLDAGKTPADAVVSAVYEGAHMLRGRWEVFKIMKHQVGTWGKGGGTEGTQALVITITGDKFTLYACHLQPVNTRKQMLYPTDLKYHVKVIYEHTIESAEDLEIIAKYVRGAQDFNISQVSEVKGELRDWNTRKMGKYNRSGKQPQNMPDSDSESSDDENGKPRPATKKATKTATKTATKKASKTATKPAPKRKTRTSGGSTTTSTSVAGKAGKQGRLRRKKRGHLVDLGPPRAMLEGALGALGTKNHKRWGDGVC